MSIARLFTPLIFVTLLINKAILEEVQSYAEANTNNIRISHLRERRQATITRPTQNLTTSEDNHRYYQVQYVTNGASLWKELYVDDGNTIKHKSLQDAHRLAVKITLGFDFVFYGHQIRDVTIATGGFLYLGDFLHVFLTATQYAAPLMANFDTSQGANESEILYREEDDVFTVQWSNVSVQGDEGGGFTFQIQLHKTNGQIVMAYKSIPYPVANISGDDHPVKVGLADAFYVDSGTTRVIYPYHKIKADGSKIKSGSAIIYNHLKTCNMLTDCDSCLNANLSSFQCWWCQPLGRCSDSFDRFRQKWVENRCPINITQTSCHQLMPEISDGKTRSNEMKTDRTNDNQSLYISDDSLIDLSSKDSGSTGAAIAAVCTIIALTAVGILAFVIYGYRNPESDVGQFLIRNRPSELWERFKTWKDKGDGGANNMNSVG